MACVTRSTPYVRHRSIETAPPDLLLCRLLDEQYTHHPFYASRRLIATMDADFCVERLEETLRYHGKPEIFNSEQGSQFTRALLTAVLEHEKIRIAMDGRGGGALIVDRLHQGRR